jgi:hypothetical protein
MKRVGVCALLLSLSAAGGCASPARYVEKTGDSGVIAIPNNTDAWPGYNMRAAKELIQKHVGANYEIIDQREVVTGQATTNNQQVNTEQTVNRSLPFLPAEKQTITNNTTQRDLTEWRIWYRRATTYRPEPFIGDINTNGLAPAGGAPRAPGGPPAGTVPSVLPAGGPAPRGAMGTSQYRPALGAADCRQ